MKVHLCLVLETDFYQLEEAREAEHAAKLSDREVYTWKTVCNGNWLERRLSNVDALGLVLLPKGLGDTVEMADDPQDSDA